MDVRPLRRYRPLALPALLAALSPAARAHADGDPQREAAEAQMLHDRAAVVEAQGRYDAACPMFEESARLVPGSIAARMAVAECYLRWGRLAAALARYAPLEAEAAAQGLHARAAEVRARLDLLRARVAELVVEVPPDAAALHGLEVRIDGILLDPAKLGQPFPIDRGSHEIRVTAPGRVPFAGPVEVPLDGATYTARVAPPRALPAPPAAAPGKLDLPPPARPSETRDAKVPGIVVLSAGAAALGIGAVTGGVALAQAGAIKSTCQGDRCPPSQQAQGQAASRLATVSTAEIVAGLAAAGAGVTLLVLRPARRAAVSAGMRAGPGGVFVVGAF
jgi:hypothetical protein